jgi:hypothetical protein
VREPDPRVLVHRDIDARDTCHCLLSRETARKNAAFYLKLIKKVLMGCAQTFLRVAERPARFIFQKHVEMRSHLYP